MKLILMLHGQPAIKTKHLSSQVAAERVTSWQAVYGKNVEVKLEGPK